MSAADGLSIVLPSEVVDLIVSRVIEHVAASAPAVEPWVGVDEVANHLACARQRIYDLTSRKGTDRIPHRKEGKRLLFKLSDVDKWLLSGRAA